VKQLRCATLDGIDAKTVVVEATFTKGLPAFSVVGLGSASIQEAKERVKAALLTNGYAFPPMRITVNLSPSDLQKSGSHFDLAIALVIALQDDVIEMDHLFVFGELGLDGAVKDAAAIFPLLLALKNRGDISVAMVPNASLDALSRIPGITYIGVESLTEAVAILRKEREPERVEPSPIPGETVSAGGVTRYFVRRYPEDFADVKGQETAKRAALIAAAGMHNLLMEGSPGCGKSMIARRLRYILPPLTLEEILQVNRYRLLGDEEPSFDPVRPFRDPHHSASKPSIFGGGSGSRARIGEVALANRGILFFDELPHFPRAVLEALREPLQDHRVLISRVQAKVAYETRFLFVAAQNPCPCGNLFSTTHACRCSDLEIKRYRQRISEPLLDRIDLYVQMQESAPEDQPSVDSATMHEQVIAAFVRQMARGQLEPNGKLPEGEIDRFCILDAEAEAVLLKAVQNFGLSHRRVANIKKVARTIADLQGQEAIGRHAILEALSYRRRE